MTSHDPAPADGAPDDTVGVVLGPAPFNAHDGIADLLRRSGLPVPDGEDTPVQMMAAFAGPHLIGCIGWERFDDHALIRSLAVVEEVRGQGVGMALVRALLDVLRGIGLSDAWLLTTDAVDWFAREGFVPIERAQIPSAVTGSREFGLNCCASARAMHRRLDPSA